MGVFVVFGLVKPVTPVLALRNFMCLAVIPKVLKELGVSCIHVPWPLTRMLFSFKRSPSLIPWRPPSTLKKTPFNVFFQQGTLNRQRRINGGVAILVRKELDQKFAFSKCGDHSQSLFVWINGCIFGSVYAPPHEDSPAEAAAQFLDFQVSCEIPIFAQWFIGGDFNEIPGKSHFEDTCSAWHGTSVCLGEPTRWEGHREIDFFITSFPEGSSKVSSLPFKVSDHKILSITFQCPSHTKETVRYKKGTAPSIPDSCTSEAWRNALSTAWEQVDREHNITNRIGHNDWDVQSQWDLLQHGLIETFVRSTQHFEPNTRFSPSRIVAKGAVASFVVNSPHSTC